MPWNFIGVRGRSFAGDYKEGCQRPSFLWHFAIPPECCIRVSKRRMGECMKVCLKSKIEVSDCMVWDAGVSCGVKEGLILNNWLNLICTNQVLSDYVPPIPARLLNNSSFHAWGYSVSFWCLLMFLFVFVYRCPSTGVGSSQKCTLNMLEFEQHWFRHPLKWQSTVPLGRTWKLL